MIDSLDRLGDRQLQPLDVTILLETLPSGTIAASVADFPDCRVEAATRNEAITRLQAAILERLQHIEVLSWRIPNQQQPPWIEFVGIFEDDDDFQSIMNTLQTERHKDDSEVDSNYYL